MDDLYIMTCNCHSFITFSGTIVMLTKLIPSASTVLSATMHLNPIRRVRSQCQLVEDTMYFLVICIEGSPLVWSVIYDLIEGRHVGRFDGTGLLTDNVVEWNRREWVDTGLRLQVSDD